VSRIPVEAQPGSPLRVAVYSRIAEAIRNNLLTPGSMLPTETELGADMKVSLVNDGPVTFWLRVAPKPSS